MKDLAQILWQIFLKTYIAKIIVLQILKPIEHKNLSNNWLDKILSLQNTFCFHKFYQTKLQILTL